MDQIEPKSSRLLRALLLGMTLLGLAAIWYAALPLALQMLISLGVIGASIRSWQHTGAGCALRMVRDGMLQYRDQHGDWLEVAVEGDTLVTPWLIVLRYRTTTGRMRTQVLLLDSADADALRRLRVWIRWASRTRSDTASPDVG